MLKIADGVTSSPSLLLEVSALHVESMQVDKSLRVLRALRSDRQSALLYEGRLTLSLQTWSGPFPSKSDRQSQQWMRLLHSKWPFLAFFSDARPAYLRPLLGNLLEGDASPLAFGLELRQGLVDLCIELDLPEARFQHRWQQFWVNAQFDGATSLIDP